MKIKIFLFLNGEDLETKQVLRERSIINYKKLLSGVNILIIDEAQKIP